LLATRAYAFKPCGADYFRGVLRSGIAQHSADFLGEFWKRRPPFISREYQGG